MSTQTTTTDLTTLDTATQLRALRATAADQWRKVLDAPAGSQEHEDAARAHSDTWNRIKALRGRS